ncbi:hypothetical protein NQ315_013386 [Exocentrus adspersus]|uniref:Tyr recombinase domain-containing protein n=1 Tax=Exocentrus adspersus TaxID=1586481 RepID=A0AAV8VT74_9CUCU|nr:hypothetical protein NQ315_013386 [Exocentrus adspersus]
MVAKPEVLGAPLQQDLAARWSSLMKDGLSEADRTALISKYPPPSNCQLLRASKLNPLVADALLDSVSRRGNRLQALQSQIGASISAIGAVLSSMLKEEEGAGSSKQYIQALSDAGRMLADILHAETISRTLTEAPVDEWLFGANLEERVKAKKEMERTSLHLKASKINQGSVSGSVEGGRPERTGTTNTENLLLQESGPKKTSTGASNDAGTTSGNIQEAREHEEVSVQVSETAEICKTNVLTTIGLLEKLGFVINVNKSQLVPSQSVRYLGFIFNSIVNNDTEWELAEWAFQDIVEKFGSPEIDLFASRNNYKCKKFVSWFKDPECLACDAFTLNWAKCFFYAFPPFSLILKTLQKILQDHAQGIVVVPLWPSQPWFPIFKSLLKREPIYFKPNKTLLSLADRSPHPQWTQITLVAGILSPTPYEKGGVPEESIDVCTASITDSTLKQYNVGLRMWWQFCSERNIDVYDVTVPSLLKFLTCQFNRGASYGSLNSYRSAVSQIASQDIANDFRMKRFFKGVYSFRPSSTKYNITWDPETVLQFIRNLPDSLSLENLTLKLAILLALASGQRVQTLASIEVHNIIIKPDVISIKIDKRLKTSGPKRPQPTIYLPYVRQDCKICVASTLLEYLEKTRDLRGQSETNLFLTYKKPHHNASVQTIESLS